MAALKLKPSGASLQNLPMIGKVAIGLVVAVLIGAGYFIIFYGEVETNIGNEEQRVAGLQAELEKAKEAREAFNRDLAELKRREALISKQKTILPDDAESPAFLSTLQTVATISGVQLVSWTPQDEVIEEFYAKVPMQLTLQGRFHQIAHFFYGIGQADRIINMENITLRLNEGASKGKGPTAPTKPGEAARIQLDQGAVVDAQCLATAFRALGTQDAGKRKGGKGKAGATAPAPASAPAGGAK
jgi:type IV pilus assembly protein PilO